MTRRDNTQEKPPGQTIQQAIDGIATKASAENPWTLLLPAGIYQETFIMKPYVSIAGDGWESPIIKKQDSTAVIAMAANTELSNLQIQSIAPSSNPPAVTIYFAVVGPSTGTAAIRNCLMYATNAGGFANDREYCLKPGNGTLLVTGCRFLGNTASTGPGGIRAEGSTGTLKLFGCTFDTFEYGAFINSAMTVIALGNHFRNYYAEALDMADASATIESPLTSVRFQNLRADGIVVLDLPSVVGGRAAGNSAPSTQQDKPRNVKIVYTGTRASTITFTITGITADGKTGQTENIQVTAADGANPTKLGSKAFAYITNIAWNATIPEGDSAQTQLGSKLGIPFRITVASRTPAYASKGQTAMQASSFTVDTKNDTIAETGVTVAAGNDYEFWLYRG